MTFAARWERRAARQNRLLGGELFRLHKAQQLTSSKNEAVRALRVAVLAVAGANAVTLKPLASARLQGSIVAGSSLEIAGESYEVGAGSVIAESRLTIAVPIAPGLVADAAVDVSADLGPGPSFDFAAGVVVDVTRKDIGADVGADLLMVVDLPTLEAAAIPEVGDGLERVGTGARGRIEAIPQSVGGSWRVQVGRS